MARLSRLALLPALLLAALPALSAPCVAGERALVADLSGSGRDALVVRAEDGAGAVVFLPAADGGFTRVLYPGMGTEVASLTLADADGDSAADLVVARNGGDAEIWRGDGHGGFLPPPSLMLTAHHSGHVAPDPGALEAARSDLEVARALAARPDLPSTRLDALTDRPIDLGTLPQGFVPRLVAAGRFLDDGGTAVAVVGGGLRPRLVIFPAGTSVERGREILIPSTTFTVQVGQGGFLFVPSTVNIQVNDTVHWVWAATGHNVVSGSPCTADGVFCSPSNTNCNANPTSSSGATYDRVFTSAGAFPFFCRPHCSFGMTGTVNVAAPPPGPGAVPDRSPGTPLLVSKAGGSALTLTWGSSCSAAASNYAVYEGSLPILGVYNHVARNCNLGNVTSTSVTPGQDQAYYLVVPLTSANEGSYGRSSAGEIPTGGGECKPQLLGTCP